MDYTVCPEVAESLRDICNEFNGTVIEAEKLIITCSAQGESFTLESYGIPECLDEVCDASQYDAHLPEYEDPELKDLLAPMGATCTICEANDLECITMADVPDGMRPCTPSHECMPGSTCLYEDMNGTPSCDCSTAVENGVSYAGSYCQYAVSAFDPEGVVEEEAFSPLNDDDFVGIDDAIPDELVDENEEEEENPSDSYCGLSWIDANSMCRKPCPSGDDAECIDLDVSSGRKYRCFSNTSCNDWGVVAEPQFSPTMRPSSWTRMEFNLLVSFYESTGGGSWARDDFWTLDSVSFCRWSGITCDASMSFDTVSRLQLPDNNLRGPFYADLLRLPNLSVLDLGGNDLYGEIPEEIGHPLKLESLLLPNNHLRGAIPSSLSRLPLLEELDLRSNSFGSFRVSNGGYNSLQSLRLDDNRLEGAFNPIIGTMTALEVLTMRGNRLSGSISPRFLPLTNLTKLDLSFNALTGMVPHIGTESDELEVNVAGNRLSEIDEESCLIEGWNNGNVGRYGCDAIACPIGTSNRLGRRTQNATCDPDATAIYIGSVNSTILAPTSPPLGGECQLACVNGGVCRGGSSLEYQYCVCPPQFAGKLCEVAKPTLPYSRPTPRPSLSFPPASCVPKCLNGGVCRSGMEFDIEAADFCDCQPGFAGPQCQTSVPTFYPSSAPIDFTYYDWDASACTFYASSDLGRLSQFESFCGGGAGYADIGFGVRDITVDPKTLRAFALISSAPSDASEIVAFDLTDGSIVQSFVPQLTVFKVKANLGGIALANGNLHFAGQILGHDGSAIHNETKLWRMDPATAQLYRPVTLPTPVASLAQASDQVMYAVSTCPQNTTSLYEIDLIDLQSRTICEDLQTCVKSLAYHPGENVLYGGLPDGCIARIIPGRCQVQGCDTEFGWSSHLDRSVTGLTVVCPRAPSPVPSTIATMAPRTEECHNWLLAFLQADIDGSQSVSESEFHSFLTSINAHFNQYEGFDQPPWTLRVVHKSLACHCEKLGYGDGCCNKEGPEILTDGLADGSSRNSEYQEYFCQQISFALAKEVGSHPPVSSPSNWPVAVPASAITYSPPTEDVFAHLSKFFVSTNGESWRNSTNWLQMEGENAVCTWHGLACDGNGTVVVGIDLANNGLAGEGIRYLEYLPSIKVLNLASNELSGPVPQFAGHQMEVLNLSRNRFTGSLGANFLESSTGLTQIDLSQNSITGHLHDFASPRGLFQKLMYMNVSSNALSSSIPVEIGTMLALEYIYLSDNRFTGEFQEPYYRDLRNLRELHLSHNKLIGSLPSFEHNPKLRKLDVSHNEMKGTIPANMFGSSSLVNYITLDISHNYFTGSFPRLLPRRLNVNAADNLFEGIDEEACSRSLWNNGAVGVFGCDGLMCPPGTYSSIGRASYIGITDTICEKCLSADFYGTTTCGGVPSKRPTQTIAAVGPANAPDVSKPANLPSSSPVALEKTFALYAIPPYLMVTTSSVTLQTRSTVTELEDVSSSFLVDVFTESLGVEDSVYITTLRATSVDRSELESSTSVNQTSNAIRRREQSADTVETYWQVDGIVGIRDGLLNGTEAADVFITTSLGYAFQSRDELLALIQASPDPALQSVSLVELSADMEICPNGLKCHHGSECVEQEVGVFACNCSAADFYEAVDGVQCEYAATEICYNGTFCVNGGECIDPISQEESDNSVCACSDPYEGSRCQLLKEDVRPDGSKTAPAEEEDSSLSAGTYVIFIIIGLGAILTLVIIARQWKAKRAPHKSKGKQSTSDKAGVITAAEPDDAMEAGLVRQAEGEKEGEEEKEEEQGDEVVVPPAPSAAVVEGAASGEEEKEEIEPFADEEEEFTVTHVEEEATDVTDDSAPGGTDAGEDANGPEADADESEGAADEEAQEEESYTVGNSSAR